MIPLLSITNLFRKPSDERPDKVSISSHQSLMGEPYDDASDRTHDGETSSSEVESDNYTPMAYYPW